MNNSMAEESGSWGAAAPGDRGAAQPGSWEAESWGIGGLGIREIEQLGGGKAC